ncbi:beta-ribofuranosylaminobenzene 5'-phosphate synthase family protein [Derxia lacustris]|uniref:beta-ribofuranosylaminobenzene 5'-phosphate synthase family protein n=1 Tax=Derxia lacustris TaxID=764842 RepID=UPI001F404C1F|nr:beta-ribofuranosylaminobenzene 5'-phosphate synthase family protein [Derxia lacustris]
MNALLDLTTRMAQAYAQPERRPLASAPAAADWPLPAARPAQVRASAPGRLHLGFLDPTATLGRRFGSIGLVIDGFATELTLARGVSDSFSADDEAARRELSRAEQVVTRLRTVTGATAPLALRLHQVLPAHAGFGSGTQLALAIGHAFARLQGLSLSTTQIAGLLGRAQRSGVGVAGFDQGGFLVDGGHAASAAAGARADAAPPILARAAFPEDWAVILVLDDCGPGLHGEAEKQAIATLPPFGRAQAADVCHQVLMRVLPGLLTRDFGAFADGITAVQRAIGEHFAPAQGGSMFTSARVARAVEWIATRTRAGIGQSSWGPTGFAFVETRAEAEAVTAEARAAGLIPAGVQVRIVQGRNTGARIAA